MMETIERMAGHFLTLLRGIADDPDQPLGTLPLLTDAENRKLLIEQNNTGTEFPETCVHHLFEEQAEKTPDATALVFSDGDPEGDAFRLTCSELNNRANQLAHYLKRKGVGPESLAGICMERSPEMIIGILGILKAGGAYLPLDSAWPSQRLAYMLEESDATVLLTQGNSGEELTDFSGEIEIVNFDADQDAIGKQSTENPKIDPGPDGLACVIYTSGSTGKPKGVMITHRNLCNTVIRANHQFRLTPDTRVLQFASFSFVMAAGDIFSALCSEAVLYVGTREALMPGDPLTNFLRINRIDVICMPASSLALMSPEKLRGVKNILVAAEPCPADMMKRWAKDRRFFIGYGMTELTGGATTKRCTASDTVPLIGRPNPNMRLYILDEDLQPVPAGVPGELYIGGAGLTRGYLNRPELTAENFIPDPFSDSPGAMICRTGDCGRYLPDGNAEFLYRTDFQISIRGFRIEPGEIETALVHHPAVESVVVAAREDRRGNKRLTAYVVPVPGNMPMPGELRDYLGRILPDYMVPALFMMMEELPRTPNGKIDRLALPQPDPDQTARHCKEYVAPETRTEQIIANICQKVLAIEKAGIKDNFFELGADSLLLVRICDQLQKAFSLDLPVVRLFEFPTVRSLGEYISGQLSPEVPVSAGDNRGQGVIKPHPNEGRSNRMDHLIVLSAVNEERLKVYAGNMSEFLKKKRFADVLRPPVTLESLAYTLQVGRKAMNERLAFVAPDIRAAEEKLERYSASEKDIEGLYAGNTKNRNTDSGLLQGREGAEFIRVIMEDRKLDRLAQLWVSGVETDWRFLYSEYQPHRIPLPTYPFAKKRHWAETERQTAGEIRRSGDRNASAQKEDTQAVAQLYYQSVWEKSELPGGISENRLQRNILIFDEDNHLADAIGKRLEEGSQIILVRQGQSFQQVRGNDYIVNPANQNDYRSLVRALSDKGRFPEKIIHFWSKDGFKPDADALKTQLDQGFYSMFYLAKTLMQEKRDQGIRSQIGILYLYKGSPETPQPQYAAVSGFVKSLMLEDSGFFCKTIEADDLLAGSLDMLADILIREFSDEAAGEIKIRYANGERFTRQLREFDPEKEAVRELPLKKNGVYLITGGMGGLGLIFAEYLAREYQAKLVLTGRSGLTSEKQAKLQRLEALGAEVIYVKADVADQEDAERIIRESREKFSAINGVIHSAGIIQRGFIRETTEENIRQVLPPKTKGTLCMDRCLQNERLDFFVLFSSISAEIESLGLPAYAFANSFLDHFAELREDLRAYGKRSGKTLFINWPLWKHGGMQPGRQTERILSQTLGMTLLKTESGLNAFTRGLIFPQAGFLFIEGNPGKIRNALRAGQPMIAREETLSAASEDKRKLLRKISDDLTNIAATLLKVGKKDIDPDETLNEYGFDSLSLTEFAGEINEKYNFNLKSDPVTPSVFFEYSTIASLSVHLLNDYAEDMAEFYRDFKFQAGDRNIETVLPPVSPVSPSEQVETGVNRFPIAIIGMSGVMPQSEDMITFWKHLENGDNLVMEIPEDRWDWKAYYGDPQTEVNKTDVRWGGFMKQVDRFDAPFFNISPREAELMDPQQRIFLETAWKCIEDAGYKPSDLSGTKTGLFVGMANSGYRELLNQHGVAIDAYMATGTAASIITNRISYLLNLHGPSEPIDTACSSSLVAIHRAITAIRNHECEKAIVGGVNVILTPVNYIYLTKAGMLSPDSRCKTFDRRADGFVRGEGAAALLLKPLHRAIADRDHIYGIVRGTAVNHGGRANSLTAPNTAAQADLLITAYENADVDPTTVGYIEAHGTGTELGDPVEIDGLKKAFTELYRRQSKPAPEKPHCGLGSVKTNIGHLEAAAGIAGLIKTVLSMKYGKLPRTLHFEEINPYIQLEGTPFYIVDKTVPWETLKNEHGKQFPRRAGVSSFGFGGANAHVVIEEYEEKDEAKSMKSEGCKPSYLAVLSAKNEERLKVYAKNLATFLSSSFILHPSSLILPDVAYTLQTGREPMEHRLAAVVSDVEDLIEKLTGYCSGRKDIEGLYTGSVKGNREGVALLTDGEEGRRFIREIIQNRKIDRLARLWVSGAEIDWQLLYPEGLARRIPLPAYPFERKRYWIPAPAVSDKNTGPDLSAEQDILVCQDNGSPARLYYHSVWERDELPEDTSGSRLRRTILIFDRDSRLADAIGRRTAGETPMILVRPGETYRQPEDHVYEIGPANPHDYRTLVRSLADKGQLPVKAVHFWSQDRFSPEEDTLKAQLDAGLYSVFCFTQAVIKHKSDNGLKFSTEILYLYKANPDDPQPQYAAMSGFMKSLMLEDSGFSCKTVGADSTLSESSDLLADAAIRELSDDAHGQTDIRYAHGERLVRQLREFDPEEKASEDLPLKKNGVYLITGGMGGLGLIFAGYLAREYQAKLVLTGRSDLTSEKEAALRGLEASGAEAVYLKADVAIHEDAEQLIRKIRQKFNGINGIIHCAGVSKRGFIREIAGEDIRQVLLPKVNGTVFLDESVKDEPLDFFVLFSSISVETESLGLSGYSFANCFMDHFAGVREKLRSGRKRKGKTLFINWPLWKDGGMQPSMQARKILFQTLGMNLLETESGLDAFSKGLTFPHTGFLFIEGDREKIRSVLEIKQIQAIQKEADTTQLTEQAKDALRRRITGDLIKTVSEILRVDQNDVDPDDPLNEYGFDSISLTEFAVKINAKYSLKTPVTPAVFFEHPDVASLALHLLEDYAQDMAECYADVETLIRSREAGADMRSHSVTDTPKFSGTLSPCRVLKTDKPQDDRYPVAIIGMSGIMPQSEDLDGFWQHLENGDHLITEIPRDRWDWKACYGDPDKDPGKTDIKWGGFMKQVDRFDAPFFRISNREAELMDPQQRIFLEAVWKCIEDAGYSPSDFSGTKTGLFAGMANSGYREILLMSGIPVETYTTIGTAASVITNRISYLLDLHGPSEPVDTACSSSLVALHRAVTAILNQECDTAIAGGINLLLTPTGFISLRKAGMLSPDGRCKTFDRRADGFVRGEGAAALLLKPLEKAVADRDHIYGIIRGTAVNHGGRANSLTAPNTAAQADLLITAYENADVDPASVGYIEAHGTGTELGDPVETDGLKKAFAELYRRRNKPAPEKPHCGLGSVKTNIGHLEAAAGIAGVIKTVLSMKHGKLPGTLHFDEINPYIQLEGTPFYIVDKTVPWETLKNEHGKQLPRRAGVSSFGFGGVNAHVVLEEFVRESKTEDVFSDEPRIFVLSAKNEERLRDYAKNMAGFLKKMISPQPKAIPCSEESGTLQEDLHRIACKILNVDEEDIDVGGDFSEYNFDPVSLSSFSEQINEKYNIETGMDIFSGRSSVNALAQYLIHTHKDVMDSHYPALPDESREKDDAATDINSADIAYTLQIGREPMAERLAIVVPGIDGLVEKLNRYCEGEKNIADVYTGNVRVNKEISGLLTGGNAGPQLVREIIEKKEFGKIASLWVMGLEPDWRLLYSQENRKRIPLPSYPFARERYWIPEVMTIPKTENIPFLSSMKACSGKDNRNEHDANITESSESVTDYLTKLIAETLRLAPQKLNPEEDFEMYGLDSIVINSLNAKLEQQFGKLPSTLFFTYKSIGALAKYFIENHKDKIKMLAGHPLNNTATVPSVSMQSTRIIPINESEKSSRDIAIIGLSGIFPMANNIDEFWENLKAGRDCITEIPKERWDYQQYPEMYCKWGGFLDDFDKFDAQFFNISPNTARSMDPQARLFLQTVWSCFEDAGYTRKRLADKNVGDQRGNIGVFAGVTFNEYPLYAADLGEKKNVTPVSPQIFSVANRVSYYLNFSGPSLSVDTACSSSLYAVHLACESIISGECEMAIAGGVNLSLHPVKYLNLCKLGFASSDGHCRAFAQDGDGYVPGEGVGVVLLKPLEKAVRDQDNIHAVIKGTAVNHDGKTHGYTVPNPVAQSEVIKTAIRRSGISPETISFLEAHGTGTSLGDPIEVVGLSEAYKEYTNEKQYCAIGSVKANIGHLEAAAGIAQLAKVTLQMKHKTLTPLILHAERTNPNINFKNTPFFLQQRQEEWHQPVIAGQAYPRRAGISSFGAGGVNVHVIVEEYEPEYRERKTLRNPKSADGLSLIPLSANARESLEVQAMQLRNFLEKNTGTERVLSLEDIAYTLQTGRESMRFRAAFAVKNRAELLEKLHGFLPASRTDPGNGIFCGEKGAESVCGTENRHTKDILNKGNIAEIAEHWVNGADFDWEALYSADKPRRISLPTYPFLKQRYWIIESPGLPVLSPDPLHRPLEQKEETGYADKDEPEVSIFLMELTDAPENEQIEMIRVFLQKKTGALLGFPPDDPPASDMGFFAMGMESMQALALQAEIEDTFRVKISDTAAFDYPDIQTFSIYLRDLIPFDELEADVSATKESPPEYINNGQSVFLGDAIDDDLIYLNPEPLPDEIIDMDIKEVEKCLAAEIEYFSKKQNSVCISKR